MFNLVRINKIFYVILIIFVFCFCQANSNVFAIEYEIRSTFLDPVEGRIYYPGNKLYVSLQLRDIDERVTSIAFYVIPPHSKRPTDPFYVDKDGSDGWSAEWDIPKDVEEGTYRISAQAFDKNGVRKGREASVPVIIKKPEVQLRVTSPPRDKKFFGGQTVYVTGSLVDRAGITKRVDFFLYRSSSEPGAEPTFSDKKLSGGCSAKFILPEKSLDEYEVLLRAFDSETEGNLLAETKTTFHVTQPEVDVRIAEPKRGSFFYPGQQIHIYGALRDSAKVVRKTRFYIIPSEMRKSSLPKEKSKESLSVKPFAVDENIEAGFSAQYSVPYETEFGLQTILVEAVGSDESSPPLANGEVSVYIKKPEIRMNVRVPAQGAYYYPGEDMYVNVDLDDRAGVVERVSFVVFPVGEPMASTFTFFDKIFSDGCGTVFNVPENIKPGKYVFQVTAKDLKGETLLEKTVEFEIKK